MTDISQEACYKIVARLTWYAKLHGSQRNHSRRADYQNEADTILALRAALDTAEATIANLTAANIDLAADNARMVKRVDEARKEFQHIAKNWPDDFAARSARAWLAGGAA